MKPVFKQGKLGILLFVTLTVFSMSLCLTIIEPSAGHIFATASLFGASASFLLTIIYKDKKERDSIKKP
ncbi:MAG: hypothetical protein LBC89_04315 [Bacteroidales bacterium]|jgi:membrane associated rhomboid family serine protease|nr:hypothetical protein [Bacteroidales bacterium]